MRRLRPHLTYANVMATIAVFGALGGSSYAALRIGSGDIVDGSIQARDVKRNALGGSRIAESKLARVPRARKADGLSAAGAESVKVKCPSGTVRASGLCFDAQPAGVVGDYGSALRSCSSANQGNRHLPTFSQLVSFRGAGGTIAPAGEFTANVSQGSGPAGLSIMVLNPNGTYSFVTQNDRRPFRCVTTPSN